MIWEKKDGKVVKYTVSTKLLAVKVEFTEGTCLQPPNAEFTGR